LTRLLIQIVALHISVLVHEGPALAAQEAAKILSAEQTWSC
jgi:hypothetical protein